LEGSGKLWNPRADHLVGSSANILHCLNWLGSLGCLTREELVRVGFDNPLRLVGRRLNTRDYAALPDVTYRDGRFQIENRSLDASTAGKA
jgi:hypothetical protein